MKRRENRVVLLGLLALVMTGLTRADVRPVLQGSLLGIGLTYPGLLEGSLLQVGGGARFGQHLGLVGGTTLLWGRGFAMWPIPPAAMLFWDFDPEQVWSHQMAYLRAAWCPFNWTIDEMDEWRGWIFSIGASYTSKYVTPHFELDLRVPPAFGPGLGVTLGVILGGTYVIQPAKVRNKVQGE